LFLQARLRVRPAPGIPCALFIERDTNDASPGRKIASREGFFMSSSLSCPA
jgi:hypothetical protein